MQTNSGIIKTVKTKQQKNFDGLQKSEKGAKVKNWKRESFKRSFE